MHNSTLPPVAVVILNWNGEKLLPEFLPQVIANSDPAVSRIIVVDNGSSDGSCRYIEENTADEAVELIRFDHNYGFAEGYNRALALCKDYTYAVLLNSDVAPANGWDKALYTFMESHPDVGACQPKILSYLHPDTFEYAGAAGGFIDRNGYPYCRGRIFGTCEEDHGQYDTEMDIFWASGAALMIRRQVYIDCGGLDPEFFAHMEEIDLCWRILLCGYRICAVPQSVVFHLGGGSLPAENPRKTYLNFRNNLLMLHKNLPDKVRKSFLIRRRLLDTVAWAKYLASFDTANAKAIFKAHRDFASMKQRYTSHPALNLLDREKLPDILTQYYIKGHRRFSELP